MYDFPIETPLVNATVPVTVKVTYRNFSKDLTDKYSPMYLNFINLFKKRMNEVYRGPNLREYKEVVVNNLLEGSIVVQSDVILETNYTLQYEELFKNLTKIVRAKILEETSALESDKAKCESYKLCYNSNDTFVGDARTNFSLHDPCRRDAADGYDQFYSVEEMNGQLYCVTRCTRGSKNYLDCNQGECQLLRSGPHCLCPSTDSHWYWGETCELNISKSLVYGLVGAVLAVLVIVMLTLAIFLGRSQRRLHSHEYSMSQEWQKEGFPGSFQNMGVWEDCKLQDRFGLENAYSRFQPSLETVNTAAQICFQRPEVLKTTR